MSENGVGKTSKEGKCTGTDLDILTGTFRDAFYKSPVQKLSSSSTVWKTKEALVTRAAKCQDVDGWLTQVTVCKGLQARLWDVTQHATGLCNVQ